MRLLCFVANQREQRTLFTGLVYILMTFIQWCTVSDIHVLEKYSFCLDVLNFFSYRSEHNYSITWLHCGFATRLCFCVPLCNALPSLKGVQSLFPRLLALAQASAPGLSCCVLSV